MKQYSILFCLLSTMFLVSSDEQNSHKVGPTRGLPVELISAMRDFEISGHNPQSQNAILWRINVALLGGAQLEQTEYTLQTITDKLPEDELWNIARYVPLWGIIKLLEQHHAAKFALDDGHKE